MNDPDRLWTRLVEAARQAPQDEPVRPPARFVDRVVARAERIPLAVGAKVESQRLIFRAAWASVALSLVILGWGWDSLAAQWAAAPPSLENMIRVGPLS